MFSTISWRKFISSLETVYLKEEFDVFSGVRLELMVVLSPVLCWKSEVFIWDLSFLGVKKANLVVIKLGEFRFGCFGKAKGDIKESLWFSWDY